MCVGALTIIWCIVWLIWISDYPEEDRWITESELQYLQETLGQSKRGKVNFKNFLNAILYKIYPRNNVIKYFSKSHILGKNFLNLCPFGL